MIVSANSAGVGTVPGGAGVGGGEWGVSNNDWPPPKKKKGRGVGGVMGIINVAVVVKSINSLSPQPLPPANAVSLPYSAIDFFSVGPLRRSAWV